MKIDETLFWPHLQAHRRHRKQVFNSIYPGCMVVPKITWLPGLKVDLWRATESERLTCPHRIDNLRSCLLRDLPTLEYGSRQFCLAKRTCLHTPGGSYTKVSGVCLLRKRRGR